MKIKSTQFMYINPGVLNGSGRPGTDPNQTTVIGSDLVFPNLT